MSRNQIINPNQLQSQFQSLHTHKTNLQHQIRTTDNLRANEQQNLIQLRTSYRNLEEKYRLASSQAGNQSKQRDMLLDEIRRLKAVLDRDASQLKELSGEVQKVEKERLKHKFEFLGDMEVCNSEMEDALRRFAETSFENVLSLESCHALIQFLEEKMKEMNGSSVSGSVESGGRGVVGEAGGVDQSEEAHRWFQVLETLRVAAERFSVATEKAKAKMEQHTLITEKVLLYRQTVQMQNTEALGDAEIDELERLWEQEHSYSTTDSDGNVIGADACNKNTNGNIYNSDVDKMNADTDGKVGADGDANGIFPQTQNQQKDQQQQPTNMDLFYGDGMHEKEGSYLPMDDDTGGNPAHYGDNLGGYQYV